MRVVWGVVTTSRQRKIVLTLTALAHDLELRGYPLAGIVRQVAGEVARLSTDEPADEHRCHCGSPLVQPRTGRPRKSCTNCAPPRKVPKSPL